MSLWERLVGQAPAVNALQRAVADAHSPAVGGGSAMTHAWLITGPPGAGRSTAAVLFAAALTCPRQGCGECQDCRLILQDAAQGFDDGANAAGGHPDVERFIPEQLTITRDEAANLLGQAGLMPSRGGYRVIIVEDADRLSDVSGNMLLKAIEEPSPTTVWLLCAPNADDVLPTIRSRCRLLALSTPSWPEVARLLERQGVDPAMAAFAARASQGHVGRARGLATDAATRNRRKAILDIPSKLGDLAACFAAAKEIVAVATDQANAEMDLRDAEEHEALSLAVGAVSATKARAERVNRGAFKDLETRQKSRRTRAVRDRLDQSLVDLLSFYRDVLVIQLGTEGVDLVNEDMRPILEQAARTATATKTRNRMEAIERARRLFASNAQPQMILEALTVELARA